MCRIFSIYILSIQFVFASETINELNDNVNIINKSTNEGLGRIGDYGYPNNPQYDRAKGYLLKGKVKNAVSNSGNFITWDYHPAGFWGEYGYLPHVGFVAGVPGHEYSSKWSNPGYASWVQDPSNNSIWFSEDAYDSWDPENERGGKYKTIVYNTVVDIGTDDRGHNDRGDIALEIVDYCNTGSCFDINNCDEPYCKFKENCESQGYEWAVGGIAHFVAGEGPQWFWIMN